MARTTPWVCPQCGEKFEVDYRTEIHGATNGTAIVSVVVEPVDIADIATHVWTHQQEADDAAG